MNNQQGGAPQPTPQITNTTIVTCEKCGAEHPLSAYHFVRPLPDSVREVGLCCPDCHDWTHIRYETPELRRLGNSLEQKKYLFRKNHGRRAEKAYYRAKEAYQKLHDAVQLEYRTRHGGESPAGLMGKPSSDIPKMDLDTEGEEE